MTKWLSIAEAARQFNYHPEHVRELVRAGQVKARKVVSVWQVDQASLAAYVRRARKRGGKTGRKKAVDF